MRRSSLFALFFIIYLSSHVQGLGCLDENGRNVDWWIAMKLPIIPNTNPVVGAGMAYSYADSKSPSLKFMSGKRLDSGPTGSIGSTMNQIWKSKGNSGVAYGMYNDQSPDGSSYESFGHLKGTFAFDSKSGFWMIHSVPRYPDFTKPYNYPSYAAVFGQSFLCLTLPTSQFEMMAKQLLFAKPHFFQTQFPPFTSSFPSFALISQGKWNTKALNSTRSFTTKGGTPFIHFSRTKISAEIYEGYVSSWFKSGLYVETWMNGEASNAMPTFCKPKYAYKNINIREVQLGGFKFLETKDHSKWAITVENAGYVCIGDLNRQFSQSKRGGGTMCLKNMALWSSFNSSISAADRC